MPASTRSRQRGVAGHDPRPGQRLLLPGLRAVGMVAGEVVERGRDRPGIAGGPQPHVDLVELPLGGLGGERADQPLAEPGVVGGGGERPRTVRDRVLGGAS